MTTDILNVKRKQQYLQQEIRTRFNSIAAFAIINNLNYNRLIGTISGRDPDTACATTLLSALGLTPEHLPRLPRRWEHGTPETGATP